MEATFYEDSRYREKSEMPRALKRPMTLDLDSSKYSKKGKVTTLLTSPDLNMLKLASPELERMIIAQHGMVTTTPTPNPCMYPPPQAKSNEDRGEYHPSRDFSDALSTIQTATSTMYHPGDNVMNNSMSIACQQPPPSCSVAMDNSAPPYYQQHTSNCVPVTTGATTMGNCYMNQNFYVNPSLAVKEEPQTVPCMGVTPPLSPIDMEDQERIKLERKRMRNRIAASKCRRRKLERIARLEDKVALLKGENAELTSIVNQLREQVCTLKQQVMEHVRMGCELVNYQPDFQF